MINENSISRMIQTGEEGSKDEKMFIRNTEKQSLTTNFLTCFLDITKYYCIKNGLNLFVPENKFNQSNRASSHFQGTIQG